ncbi:MAG TPA: HAD family hydrolase [Fervidobacterium sp.]|nr:HAD family hydrolase [Fervidobacterium sp.]
MGDVVFLRDNSLEQLKQCKLFILDIDGTFYLSGKPFDGSKKFVDTLDSQGKKLVFLTNNSNRTIESYIEEFSKFGFNLSNDQILTAGVATAQYLFEEFGKKRVYIVGTDDIKTEFARAGHVVVEDDPEIVVVTFDKTLTYEKLKKATLFVSRGAIFVVTNPDLNCPSSEGPLPDSGAIASVIRKATGLYPNIVFGKPQPRLIEIVMKQNNIKPAETCMIGDRLYTDILAGIQAGVLTVLVLTGEATKEEIKRSPIKPDIIAHHIGEIAELLKNEL